MNKMMIKTVSKTEARVSKAFQKKAVIFGTPEYQLWREYLKDFPEAKMTTASIKRDSEKSIRNMKYENMKIYISAQENAGELQKEFDRQMKMAKLQNSPYRYMLDWFKATFPNYKSAECFQDKQTDVNSIEENNAD